jgi:hypothetical protein
VGSVLGWIAAGVPSIMAGDRGRAGRYVLCLLYTAAGVAVAGGLGCLAVGYADAMQPNAYNARGRTQTPKGSNDYACTSHVEWSNLSIRVGVRRMTRLTNAFSKKWGNHEAHLAIRFLYYNFCRVHMPIKTTPAVKAGIADEKWSVERLLDELAIHC